MTLIQTAFLGCPKATRDHSRDNKGESQQLISLWTAGPAHLPGELSLEASESQPWLLPVLEQAAFSLDGPNTSTAWIMPPFPVPPLVHFLLPFPTLGWEFWI